MASEREKQNLDDEEIIDLTEVVEEGPDSDKKASDQGDDSAQDGDFDEDLSDLFESLSSEEDDKAGSAEGDDDFEDLFNDEAEQSEDKGSATEEQETGEDDFLKEFLEDDQEDDSGSGQDSSQEEDGDITDDLDDLISDVQEDDDSEDTENSAQDSRPEKRASQEAEEPESDSQNSEVEDFSEDIESGEPASASETDEKPLQGIEVLAEQLESLSDRMDTFERKIDEIQNDFPDKAVQLMEEKGPELEFMRQALQGVKDELEVSIKSNIEQAATGEKSLSEDEFKEQVIEAVEEKGLEFNFVQEMSQKFKSEVKEDLLPEIEEKIKSSGDESQGKEFEYPEDFREKVFSAVEEKVSKSDYFEELTGKVSGRLVSDLMEQMEKLIAEKVSEQSQPDQENESEVQQKLADLEARVQDLKMPDEENIRQEVMADVKKFLEGQDSDDGSPLDDDVVKDQIKEEVEAKLNSLVEEWQSEKKALAGELENALKFWGKMQEKLTVLSQDIGELRDTRAEIDPEMQEKIESLTEQAVTRPELRHLASQLKVELEDYIAKKVPEAAAKVIREEISAIINGAGK